MMIMMMMAMTMIRSVFETEKLGPYRKCCRWRSWWPVAVNCTCRKCRSTRRYRPPRCIFRRTLPRPAANRLCGRRRAGWRCRGSEEATKRRFPRCESSGRRQGIRVRIRVRTGVPIRIRVKVKVKSRSIKIGVRICVRLRIWSTSRSRSESGSESRPDCMSQSASRS